MSPWLPPPLPLLCGRPDRPGSIVVAMVVPGYGRSNRTLVVWRLTPESGELLRELEPDIGGVDPHEGQQGLVAPYRRPRSRRHRASPPPRSTAPSIAFARARVSPTRPRAPHTASSRSLRATACAAAYASAGSLS